jgi:cell wall-associated NlpC family hydrolase
VRTHAIIGARWEPMPAELLPAQDRLERVLASWDRTPYRSGGSMRGVEGDCIGAVFGVIDELDGRVRRQDSSMPHDTAFHNPAAAYRAVAALRRLYRPAERLRHWLYQPGDVLVVGTSDGGPGHVMIVGGRKNTLWHATTTSGFAQCGWALGLGFERLFAAYRFGDRERWLR